MPPPVVDAELLVNVQLVSVTLAAAVTVACAPTYDVITVVDGRVRCRALRAPAYDVTIVAAVPSRNIA